MFLRRIQRYLIVNIRTYSFKVPNILVTLQQSMNFPHSLWKSSGISNILKPFSIGPVVRCGWEDGRTNERTDITNLVVIFQKRANRLN